MIQGLCLCCLFCLASQLFVVCSISSVQELDIKLVDIEAGKNWNFGGDTDNWFSMSSASFMSRTPLPMTDVAPSYCPYPAPEATYEDVVVDPNLFMHSLEKLHASMGTKFMIPIIGGRDLDLHKLFVEVTSRGGIEKIVRERKWKEITAVFNFPSTATNASFVLRKYYCSLLHHYEQIYYFKARGWTPMSVDSSQSPSTSSVSVQRTPLRSSSGIESSMVQQPRVGTAESPGVMLVSSAGSPVIGVIDGKFESGYLVTVTVGAEKLKGVLYQAPQSNAFQTPQLHNIVSNVNNGSAPSGVQRRRRRKKSEIKRRDPAHPKPNRSGYNFFFQEQHARLKPMHQGKDRDISRMIGELWNKLNESEKAVYQEQALKDKERYRIEMESYRERLNSGGQVISNAVPLQQRRPDQDTDMVDAHAKIDETEEDSPMTPEDMESSSSGGSYYEEDQAPEKDLEMDVCPLEASVQTSNEMLKKDESSVDEKVEKNDDTTTSRAVL